MTFCAQCKQDLAEAELEHSCCAGAQLYGMLLFSRRFSRRGIEFQSEHAFVADRLVTLLTAWGIAETAIRTQAGARDHLVLIEDTRAADRLLTDFGYTGDELSLRVLDDNFVCESCLAAFLGGCFLAGGTITDPKVNYHLEFVSHKSNLIADLAGLLARAGFSPGATTRSFKKVLYIKNSAQIEDFLTYIGAVGSSLELMATKVYKDIKNRTNRRVNCENANIDKAVAAAASDIESIEYILQNKGRLPEELRELAQLRVENPELSLAELGALTAKPLTKSGVSHRMRRIRETARRLREETDGN